MYRFVESTVRVKHVVNSTVQHRGEVVNIPAFAQDLEAYRGCPGNYKPWSEH